MQSFLEKLLHISSPPLGVSLENATPDFKEVTIPSELFALLKRKNGFFAFEHALHVFPLGNTSEGYNLLEWNAPDLWRGHYAGLLAEGLFFAQDIFGEQFWLKDTQIHRFNPETGALEHMADNMEEWAELLLTDYTNQTGYPLAHQWQQLHGRLAAKDRLVPKILFIFEGEYSLSNLYSIDAAKGMQSRAAMSNQIKHLPDGTKVRLVVTD